GDTLALDETELMVAFYYTITTQTLNSYKNNTRIQFDAKEFFRIVVKKFIEQNEESINTGVNNIKKVIIGYQT
ncbi:MAG: hypothetical protein HRT44_02755, partial [Bdellovibrionales bacterium]|nr:hypothetical protein [Bdellovibrionales bacterium]